MKAETRSHYLEVARRAAARIAASLDAALDLGALAREAALAPLHFHHVFRGVIGETPLELHRRLRLERAAWQLCTSDRPVTVIALDAGYETHEAFTRAFRRRVGMAPSELRREALAGAPRRPIHLQAACAIHVDATGAAVVPVTLTHPGVTMHVELETLPAMRVLTVRHVGPYPRIGEAFERLHQLAAPALGARPARVIAIYHDDPESTPADALTSDAGIVVDEDVVAPAGVTELRISAGEYARATHEGAYASLGDTWARLLGGWLPTSGRRLGPGGTFEIYRNTPMTAAEPELRTDLYVSLAP